MVHIYEYTTRVCILLSCRVASSQPVSVSVTPSMKIEGVEKCVVPVQIILPQREELEEDQFPSLVLQRLRANPAAKCMRPPMPGPTSIYHMWEAFDINPNVGGACGEIVAFKGKYGQYLINPLVAAQNFEYKMSNILDKPLKSVFGYITVLPGAFSAYRYIALQNHTMGEGLLQKYFLGEKMHGAGADIFTANMYLAEDRVGCVQVPLFRDFSLFRTIDIMLGIGLETWGIVDSALRQVRLCCHQCP